MVEKQSETDYTLAYTLQFSSDLLGDVTYDYTADIVSGPQGYSILYTPSLILPTLEEGDKVRTASQTGARGEIFSADGAVLAKNDYAQSVYLDLEKNPDIEEVKSFLTANFSADAEKIQKKYDNAVEKGYPLEVLLTYPKNTLTDEQKQAISEVNGLGVDEERLSPIRYYPYKDDAAHIIGYMGSPSEEQLEQDVYKRQIYSITKRLYPEIAEHFHVTATKVELAIRHTIEVMYDRDKMKNVSAVLGFPVGGSKQKPTNGEFIALLADKLISDDEA